MKTYSATGLLALALSQLFSQSLAVNFYVSPTGSDTNPGTSAKPFLTLARAQVSVRTTVLTQSSTLVVFIADGVYSLAAPLNFTAADSGKNGFSVEWRASGSNAVVSGGTKLGNWTLDSTTGIYSTSVPAGTVSRNLYIGGKVAQYARTRLSRGDFSFTATGLKWTNSANNWLTSLPGIETTEIRAINSFTDRVSPVASSDGQSLIMEQPAWSNNIIGWDTISTPFYEGGFYIQNSLALLTDGGEYFLDSSKGTVYYKPLAGEDMEIIDAYLGRLEVLLSIGGTYDNLAHDIAFKGLNFAHTTWNRPTGKHGYVDQQTGGYWGDDVTYPIFEASRPHWYQMPSGIQISAAKNIQFLNGHYSQFGAGGFGIGNDPNAHLSGVGLGAQDISIIDGHFTQIMGNSITGGGIQADAHHPSDARMINSKIEISGNIFFNNSAIYSSTVPIFVSYIQYSTISNNDLSYSPYSGICFGYGWGANDAGGSDVYLKRGLYNYQPLYTTPTTSMNNKISGNLIHNIGLAHTDLGGIYTLSASPGTVFSNNYDYEIHHFGLYTDEGSNGMTFANNVFFSDGNWYNPNQGTGMNTANNTLIDNFGFRGWDAKNAPDGTGVWGNTFIRNYVLLNGLDYASTEAARTVYRAGILPGKRGSRPVSNGKRPDSSFGLYFHDSYIIANLSNFDDAEFPDVRYTPVVSAPYTLTPSSVRTTVARNTFATSSWQVKGTSCSPPTVSMQVQYTNSRSGVVNTITQVVTSPGMTALGNSLKSSSSWAGASFGQTCSAAVVGITASGRDSYQPDDDWASLYQEAAISESGTVTAYVKSIDPTNPWTKSGIVLRNSLVSGSRSPGYAILVVTPANGVSFQYDNSGDGILDTYVVAGGIKAPLYLRLAITSSSVVAAYSKDLATWVNVGSTITLNSRASTLDAGMIHTSHMGFKNATAIFSNFTVTA